MRRRLIAAAAAVTLTGCTPGQLRAWINWHAEDPDAAIEFAQRPEVIEDLASGEHEEFSASATPGDCDSYAPLFVAHGLPVSTFKRIAWRESGCNHRSFVRDSDDLGGGLLGLNLRAGAGRWFDWCGLTSANVTDAETNVACAAVAYRRMGMAPWS
jgi:hypothetical protein